MEFSISLHLEDGRLTGGNDSLLSLSSPLLSPLRKHEYDKQIHILSYPQLSSLDVIGCVDMFYA